MLEVADFPSCLRFGHAERKSLRAGLVTRGAMLASLLSDVLSGLDRDATIIKLGIAQPGVSAEVAVRRALGRVDIQRKLLDAVDDRYGRCEVCGLDLGLVALREAPWADRCAAH